MSKIKLFQSKNQRGFLAVALISIAVLLVFDSGVDVDERLGMGVFIAILFAIAAGGIFRSISKKTQEAVKNIDTASKYFSYFKISAILGALISGLVWGAVFAFESLDIGSGTDLGVGILLVISFYAGLALAALSIVAMIVILLLLKDKEKKK